MIELRHVWVERQRQQILSDVTFEVDRGEFVYLLGPDGAGKSTILSLILFEQRPTRGRVFVGNCDSETIQARGIPFLRRRVGMVLQSHKLLRDRTVFQNVAISLEVTGLRSSVVKKRTLASLSDVGLIHKRRAYPDALSGGEQQRVAIARALVNEPAVVLADEPTANQDPEGTELVMEVLADANRSGTAVLMATHDVDLVNRSPRRTLYLREGRLQSPDGAVPAESISEST